MLHWKTKLYLDIRDKDEYSGSGGEKDFTLRHPRNDKEIMTVPTRAVMFLDMAWQLITEADHLIEKDNA